MTRPSHIVRLRLKDVIHGFAQTTDMDMKLILAARTDLIDGHADGGSWVVASDDTAQYLARFPGGLEVVEAIRERAPPGSRFR